MRIHELLDLMYDTNEIQILERPDTILFKGKVKDALKSDDLDISREIISVRPVTNNLIKIFVD